MDYAEVFDAIQMTIVANLLGLFVLKITSLVMAFLTIRLGHDLIRSGVKGEFKFSGEASGVRANLVSVSPGLLFVLLGVMLIAYSITIKTTVSQRMRLPQELTPPWVPTLEVPIPEGYDAER